MGLRESLQKLEAMSPSEFAHAKYNVDFGALARETPLPLRGTDDARLLVGALRDARTPGHAFVMLNRLTEEVRSGRLPLTHLEGLEAELTASHSGVVETLRRFSRTQADPSGPQSPDLFQFVHDLGVLQSELRFSINRRRYPDDAALSRELAAHEKRELHPDVVERALGVPLSHFTQTAVGGFGQLLAKSVHENGFRGYFRKIGIVEIGKALPLGPDRFFARIRIGRGPPADPPGFAVAKCLEAARERPREVALLFSLGGQPRDSPKILADHVPVGEMTREDVRKLMRVRGGEFWHSVHAVKELR